MPDGCWSANNAYLTLPGNLTDNLEKGDGLRNISYVFHSLSALYQWNLGSEAMGRSSRRTDLVTRVKPRTKLWLEVNSQYVFGLGISEILKAVQHTGSIKAAAREVGKSYRHVWDKIKQAEQALGAPLVQTQVGGKDARRSELSDLAQDLIRDYDGFRQRLFDLVQVEFSQHLQNTLEKHSRD
jgi:molybdate transport system regulatory protein